MGGNTGNLRTLRNQSGTVGYRTLGSILASGVGGAGSTRRLYGYYANRREAISPFTQVFDIYRGQFQSRAQWFLQSNYF